MSKQIGKHNSGQYGYFVGFQPNERINTDNLNQLRVPESDYAVFKYKTDLTQIHKTVMKDICRSIMIAELSLNKMDIEFITIFEDDFHITSRFFFLY